jgi:hypothetical protein
MVFTDLFHIPIALSLGIVAAVLGTSMIASLLWPPREPVGPPVGRKPPAGSGEEAI